MLRIMEKIDELGEKTVLSSTQLHSGAKKKNKKQSKHKTRNAKTHSKKKW